MLRYRVTKPDGKRVEHGIPVGLVRDLPKKKDAWREVDKLELLIRINEASCDARITFTALAEHYLKADFGADAVRPKSGNTKTITEHVVRDYLSKRWGKYIADEIKPLDAAALAQIPPRRRGARVDDDLEDAWRDAPRLQGRHPP